MPELADEVYLEIKRLCALGDDHAQMQNYGRALESYQAAWELLPAPKYNWEAAAWILGAIGDTCFLAGDYKSACENISHAMLCPAAVGNPFLHLRLGQCLMELSELDRAADELMRAYMGSGPAIFEGEDPKYISFLKTRADAIEG